MQKAKDRYHNCGGKEKAAEYYTANKEVLNKNTRNKYRNLSEKENEVKIKYGKNRYKKNNKK